jgi:hypothetical protein
MDGIDIIVGPYGEPTVIICFTAGSNGGPPIHLGTGGEKLVMSASFFACWASNEEPVVINGLPPGPHTIQWRSLAI